LFFIAVTIVAAFCIVTVVSPATITTPAVAQNMTGDNATIMVGNMTADNKTGGNWNK